MKQTITVLGCMRSGTSLTAGILHNLGVHMGDELRKQDRFNDRGYFEDIPLMRLNDKILERAGGTNWSPPDTVEALRVMGHYDEQIVDKNDVLGCKVGMNLTIEGWLHILRSPKVVIIFRNPIDTMQSMVRVKKIDNREAIFLVRYYQSILLDFWLRLKTISQLRNIPVILISFEQLLMKPQKSVDDLCLALQLDVTVGQKKQAYDFIKKL